MICKHITKRSYQLRPYIWCRKLKKKITWDDCKNCVEIEPRENKTIKKKSNKLAKLERNRFSILTNDLEHCFACKFLEQKTIKKDDLHEIYQGKNRQISIKNGFVAPLCRKCHKDESVKVWLKRYCQQVYLKKHTEEKFIKLIEDDFIN